MDKNGVATLTLHAISDSLGTTAVGVVNSAAVQFPHESVRVSALTKVDGIEQVRAYLDRYVDDPATTAVFHTILNDELRRQLRDELESRGIASVDVLGPAMQIISKLARVKPLNVPGLVVDRNVVKTVAIDASDLV